MEIEKISDEVDIELIERFEERRNPEEKLFVTRHVGSSRSVSHQRFRVYDLVEYF